MSAMGYHSRVVRYRQIRPSARLRTFVNSFWILEHDGEDRAPQRVVPDGRSELILNWGEPLESLAGGEWRGQPRCFFAGQIDGPLLLRPKGPAKMLGIGFHPHGASRVLAPPMHELSGRFTRVDELSQSLARELNRALESPEPVAAVEAALVASERKPHDVLIAGAVRRITIARGACDLGVLAREMGMSVRQLERRFQSAVGLPPKLFCRMQRFNGVFQVMEQQPCDWAEAALECGYYDQAHLIRDCKSLSGRTPAILLDEDADLARHFYMSHSYNPRRRGSV
jgi:AraC-like DNA-binding protein